MGKGTVVAIDHGNITLNKGPAVQLKSFDRETKELLEGEEAAVEFRDKRHQGGAELNDIDV